MIEQHRNSAACTGFKPVKFTSPLMVLLTWLFESQHTLHTQTSSVLYTSLSLKMLSSWCGSCHVELSQKIKDHWTPMQHYFSLSCSGGAPTTNSTQHKHQGAQQAAHLALLHWNADHLMSAKRCCLFCDQTHSWRHDNTNLCRSRSPRHKTPAGTALTPPSNVMYTDVCKSKQQRHFKE